MNITDKKRRDVVVEVVVEDRMWAKHYAQTATCCMRTKLWGSFGWEGNCFFLILKIAHILRISVNTNKIHSRICLFRQDIFCWVIQIHGQLELCLVRFDVSDIKFTSRFDKTLGLTVKFLKKYHFLRLIAILILEFFKVR